jgi:hypothetical protein
MALSSGCSRIDVPSIQIECRPAALPGGTDR